LLEELTLLAEELGLSLDKLTPEETRLVELLVAGHTQEECAHALGRTRGSVWRMQQTIRGKLVSGI